MNESCMTKIDVHECAATAGHSGPHICICNIEWDEGDIAEVWGFRKPRKDEMAEGTG